MGLRILTIAAYYVLSKPKTGQIHTLMPVTSAFVHVPKDSFILWVWTPRLERRRWVACITVRFTGRTYCILKYERHF